MTRGALCLLLAVVALAWFCNIGARRLIKADEGRYAEIAREMVASGDWLTPRLNGFKYFEKPPLQYWSTAAAFALFGQADWAARLWPALTGFLGLLFVFYVGNRATGPPAGLLAAAVLAGSLLYVLIAHVVTLDTGLSFFLSAAVFSFVMAQLDAASAAETRNWMLAAWALAALAVLSKGLIGIVLPCAALALYVLAERDWRLLGRLHIAAGMAVFLVVAAPWFIAVSIANREFFDFFFVHEHFERFLTKVHGRYQPLWYFVPVLLGGILPWTVTLIPAAWRAWRRKNGLSFQPLRFLLIWSGVVFAFFSVSDSKLASYILPIFPAIALLIAAYIAEAGRRVCVAQAVLFALFGLAFAWCSPLVLRLADAELPGEYLSNYVPWLAGAGLALGACSGLAALLHWRGKLLAGTLALAAGGLAFTQITVSGHGELSPVYSAYHIVERVRPQLKADAPFYVVNTFDHTLPYYLGRKVTMVVYKDELEKSVGWEPQEFIPDLATFVRRWRADREAYAMFSPQNFDDYAKTLGMPMTVLARDARRVIVKKP